MIETLSARVSRALLIAAALFAADHAWADVPQVRVTATKKNFHATDRVGVEIDTRAFRDGSNYRLIVVPAGSPDPIPNANEFALASTSVRGGLVRLTLPPGPPGASEIRLYYIPLDSSRFAVAGRAAVEIGPRTPNATLAHDLTNEAKALGPVRFEAKYRDQPFNMEGQFLRVETRTAGPTWEAIIARTYKGPRDYMAMYIGHLGTEKRADGPIEVLCLMDAENKKNIDRAAQLNPGDPVLLHGHATHWGRVYESQVVIFDRCVFAK
ncbi:hypothetical protein GJW-30_1_02541 [Variibacter gotjawalensis]|uniref:Uncharacterized protein n=1 Tax=Variibacter gotjawalensis TaxID=1333996 RepID=A0A0S3PVM4_9BRAD|nr:hypothetical protein [Variibacter gotjawalensis]NIK45828.1 hypothetical protein [Variibacter gotjawalensis]RZS47752.1 hypothetical protein EV661_0145 [Variibacter gotjawalensis]BAT60006.1 hypothetical protein GJW-30_1_02541 [Variibacter gotjawalensis]